ncbi:MAG TPA: helix-turn-helix transcriptional regulator [Nitrospiria bacterium]|nr:helix-turn-helix transcriptional regulator [Nitrospiria bacterium]
MENSERPLFPISVVAQMFGVHPQTLRLYEREGLISPGRTKGKTRLYSQNDVEKLKTILHFTQEQGINLAGVGLLLEIQKKMNEMQGEIWRTLEHLQRGLEMGMLAQHKRETPEPPKSTPKKIIKVKIEQG